MGSVAVGQANWFDTFRLTPILARQQEGILKDTFPSARPGVRLSAVFAVLLCWSAVGRAAEPSEADRAQLASLQKEIEELYGAAKYREAIPVAEKRLKLVEKIFGPDKLETAESCNDLGELFFRDGDYTHAAASLQRGLSIAEKALGPEDVSVAKTLVILGELHMEKGDLAAAELIFKRALKIREKALGPDELDLGEVLADLSELYRSIGDYGKAEPLSQRALKIYETKAGPEHPNTATVLNNQAMLYQDISDYAKAEPLLQRALAISEKALGPDHPEVAFRLNNLAVLYMDQLGEFARAEPLLLRALKIRETALGPEHLLTVATLMNLASCYDYLHQTEKAESLYQKCVSLQEKLEPDHAATAITLSNFGHFYAKLDQSAKAEALYRRALKIEEKAVGLDHPDTALILQNLAWARIDNGDLADAEQLYRRALKIDETTFGPDHPDTERVLRNLAALKIDQGKANDALTLAVRADKAGQKRLANILSFTSEEQRLAFANTVAPYNVLGTLGRAAELAQVVLRYKGIVLDSLLEDRLAAEASANPTQRETVGQARAAKQRLMKLLLEVPKDASEEARRKRELEKEQLSKRVEELEASLARQFAGLGKARRALGVTVAQVQGALAAKQVLIELVLYNHYLGKNKSEGRYGALVIVPSGETKWVPLGNAADIKKSVSLYQKSARGQTDEATLNRALRGLHAQIWEGIEKVLPPDARTVIISPDAELSFVSFATLLAADGKFLGEKYSIRYVASGRDLLRENMPSANPATVIYANPDFGAAGPTPATISESGGLRSTERSDLQSVVLPPLPGTAKEAAALAERAGKSATLFLESAATEAELRRVAAPRVLHLATHGFFLPEINAGGEKGSAGADDSQPRRGKLVNPMHRSGVAMAGAQNTLQAWGKGEVPPTDNDGIVTAEEVGGLKLDGTWLVTLSACETGSGEVRAGEGVIGLRRGFVQAGAKNLLMTLWPISDETTIQIMMDFYEKALRSKDAAEALAETQRAWLVRLRQEKGLLAAVRLAGPFIMSSQGKP
jgi:CHAT domain-containing protein/tetratricopeptide (TPR) repeat protein